jgi:hypothetical protein
MKSTEPHSGLAQVQAYSQATNEAKETPAPESGKAAGRLVTCSAGLYGAKGWKRAMRLQRQGCDKPP